MNFVSSLDLANVVDRARHTPWGIFSVSLGLLLGKVCHDCIPRS